MIQMSQTGTTSNTDQQTISTVENFTDTALSDRGGVVTSTPIRPEGKSHAEIPPCHFVRGGKCVVHGKKATKKTRRVGYDIPGPDGKTLRRYQKKTYWECDLDPVKGVFL